MAHALYELTPTWVGKEDGILNFLIAQQIQYFLTHTHTPLTIIIMVVSSFYYTKLNTTAPSSQLVETAPLHYSPLAEPPPQLTNWCNDGCGVNTFIKEALRHCFTIHKTLLEVFYAIRIDLFLGVNANEAIPTVSRKAPVY